MQGTQRLGQTHHPLRQLGWQQLGNGAGIQQLQRLIGQLTQRRLLDAFGRRVNRGERLLHLRRAEIALNAVLRVDHLCAVFPAFGFAIGQHPAARCQAVLHCRAEVEKSHGENAGAVAYLAGHHPASAERDVAVQDFAFNGGINGGQQIANFVQLGAVFITQGKVEQEILHRVQADFSQLIALRRAHARQAVERDGIQQAAFHRLPCVLHGGPPPGIGFDLALRVDVGVRQFFLLRNASQHRITTFKQQALLFIFRQHTVAALVHPGVLTLALRLIQNERGGHGDVQGLHHADHRNDDVPICQIQRFLGDPGFLLAHQNTGRAGVVDLAKIHGFSGQVGGKDLHTAPFQVRDRIANRLVRFNGHPAVAACRRRNHGSHPVARPDGVHFMHADGICGTDDSRDVMRFMDLLHADRQVRLTPGEHFAYPRVTL